MSKMQRSKGRRGEREVLARLNLIGGDGVILYGQEELGGARGDVETNHGLFEVKRRAQFPAWMTLRDEVRGCYVRRDRGEWMVLVRASDFETLMGENRKLRSERAAIGSIASMAPHGVPVVAKAEEA